MHIHCPQCSTKFYVRDEAIQASGQRVRCGRCRHDWLQLPPVDEVVLVEEVTIVTEAPTLHRAASVQSSMAQPVTRKLWFAVAACLLVFVIGASALIGYRDAVVALWTPAAKLYQAANMPVAPQGQGLAFSKLNVKTADNQGAASLIVSGEISNTTQQVQSVPDILLTVRDPAERPLKSWSHLLQKASLQPGQRLSFETRQPLENKLASNIVVEFSNDHIR